MLMKGGSRRQKTRMLWRVRNCVKVEKTDKLLIKKRKNNMGRNFNRESVQKSQMLRMNGWIIGKFSI